MELTNTAEVIARNVNELHSTEGTVHGSADNIADIIAQFRLSEETDELPMVESSPAEEEYPSDGTV